MPCNKPITLKNGNTVPCRRCLGCKIDRRNEWTYRVRFEQMRYSKLGFPSSFVTLTYSDKYHTGKLSKKDLQDFIKRLRYYVNKTKHSKSSYQFKYLAVGEYGGEKNREHLHLILLGLSPNFLRSYINKAWQFGLTDVRPLANPRIRYLFKYLDKNINSREVHTDETTGMKVDKDGVPYPFFVCSKGIGSYAFSNSEFIKDGKIIVNGRTKKIPKYFAKKFGIEYHNDSLKYINAIKKEAVRLNMTYRDYVRKLNYDRELKNLNSARLNSPVDNSSLLECESYLDKGFCLDNIINEV